MRDESRSDEPSESTREQDLGEKSHVTGTERLLESAIELFGRDGFGATSVRAIAQHAGVSFGLIRMSYGSKEGLLDAAERAVFSEWSQLLSFSGDFTSQGDVLSFLRQQADNLGKLRAHVRFIRRCILEDRPIANEMLRTMLDLSIKDNYNRLKKTYPNETFLSNPLRVIFQKIGYILISPNIADITGIELLSFEEIEKINLEELRVMSLIEAGLKAEAASTPRLRAD